MTQNKQTKGLCIAPAGLVPSGNFVVPTYFVLCWLLTHH